MLQTSRRLRRYALATAVSLGLCAPHLAAQESPAAQASAVQDWKLPAGALGETLNRIASQGGRALSIDPALVRGKRAPAIAGRMSTEQAAQQALAGSNLQLSSTPGGTWTLVAAPADGEIVTGALSVEGNRQVNIGADPEQLADQPYTSPGSYSYISGKQVEQRRGTSTGDFLSGIAGVLNGDARNSGALDVNIRGMQGEGRVPVVIDGASNQTTAYRGYNGAAARSYLDPDFIGSVSIEKGPSAGSDAAGATGGIVRVSTIGTDDILPEGATIGGRLRVGFNGNSSAVPANTTRGGVTANWPDGITANTAPEDYTGSPIGLDRPGLLEPTGWFTSLAVGGTSTHFDWLAAYARRENGNFHAGGKGDEGGRLEWQPNSLGTALRLVNASENFYRADEEILNTSTNNTSWLFKGTARWGEQALELAYNRYDSAYGEVMPTQIQSSGFQGTLNTLELDSLTARYRWNPDANDLLNLRVDAFHSDMDNRINSTYFTYQTRQAGDIQFYGRTQRWGLTADNKSVFEGWLGTLALDYGLGIIRDDLGVPDGFEDWIDPTNILAPRKGWREEYTGNLAAAWSPWHWLTLDAGLRFEKYRLHDENHDHRASESGWSPLLTVTAEPWDGIQFYARHARTRRMPSAFEGLRGFSLGNSATELGLTSERTDNIELGFNLLRQGVFTDGDRLGVHVAWFDNQIDDYITRAWQGYVNSRGYTVFTYDGINLDYAQMRGFEISAEYDARRWFGNLSWSHYNHLMFCLKDDVLLAPATSTVPAQERCTASGPRNSYAMQHVPPKDSVTLGLGARFLGERLTIGTRLTHMGTRFVPEDTLVGYGQIRVTNWGSYNLLDLYASYAFDDTTRIDIGIDNATDRYYMDAIAASLMPAPGRTFRLALTKHFGNGTGTASHWGGEAFDGDWSGGYVGAHVGRAEAQVRGSTTAGDGTAGGIPATESANASPDGTVSGLQLGWNHQFANNWVAGAEIDYSWTHLVDNMDVLSDETELLASNGALQASLQYDLSRFVTARLRLGRAFGNTLVYATGGLALLDVTQTRSQYKGPAVTYVTESATSVESLQEREASHSGWTAGLGVEHALNQRWSVKAEYQYAELAREQYHFDDARTGVTADIASRNQIGTYGTINGRIANDKVRVNSFRLGLNYRF